MNVSSWIETDGGPLVLVPEKHVRSWGGTENQDYDDACEVGSYTGLLDRPWGQVLVFGDENLPTTVLQSPDETRIVRWVYGDEEPAVISLASSSDLDSDEIVESLDFEILEDQNVVLFDSAASAGEQTEKIRLWLRGGRYKLMTRILKGKAVKLLIHVFVTNT